MLNEDASYVLVTSSDVSTIRKHLVNEKFRRYFSPLIALVAHPTYCAYVLILNGGRLSQSLCSSRVFPKRRDRINVSICKAEPWLSGVGLQVVWLHL